MPSQLTKTLYRLRRRLIQTMPTRPEKGMLPLDEFIARTPEEMQMNFDLFWNPRTHAYDPEDNWRLPADPAGSMNPSGNVAVVGCWFISTRERLQLFDAKRILNPLSCNITRKQWRIILHPLIVRDANWCWLPGIIDAHEGDASWRLHSCIGWSCHQQKFYKPNEWDYVLGPNVCALRRDVKEKEWTGISILSDITSTRSGLN